MLTHDQGTKDAQLAMTASPWLIDRIPGAREAHTAWQQKVEDTAPFREAVARARRDLEPLMMWAGGEGEWSHTRQHVPRPDVPLAIVELARDRIRAAEFDLDGAVHEALASRDAYIQAFLTGINADTRRAAVASHVLASHEKAARLIVELVDVLETRDVEFRTIRPQGGNWTTVLNAADTSVTGARSHLASLDRHTSYLRALAEGASQEEASAAAGGPVKVYRVDAYGDRVEIVSKEERIRQEMGQRSRSEPQLAINGSEVIL
ncbi:hypothetical protein ACFSBZ_06750 [Amnibacterium flavum]|uniref:Uncharacterized protein n=1 Tax=Amnibacterium flavum TaxID=2173173 RepID=A0A2V1HMN0_9MICO|nr:hypothetical protein [Amnibacterium flavum]PVZ93856.1 hypothetical protein DDQ50_08725 [Amnibacterium flavum]